MTAAHQLRRGFSLIELMFSMAIGSIILILAATMLGTSGEGYERIGGSVASEREARALITQLSADLSTAKFHKDGIFKASSQPWPVDSLGFLSLQPATAQTEAQRIGDVCAVNYYIKDLDIGGKKVRCLMRGFRESNASFKALRDGTVATLFDPLNDDEPVAFGVVSFEARPKSRDAAGVLGDWVKSDTVGPDAIEVRLVIARRDLVGRLTQSSDWDGSGNLLGTPDKADRNKNLEIHATTLRFGNHAAL